MATVLSTPTSRSARPTGLRRFANGFVLALVIALFLAVTLHRHYGPIDPASIQTERLDWRGNSAGIDMRTAH